MDAIIIIVFGYIAVVAVAMAAFAVYVDRKFGDGSKPKDKKLRGNKQ